MILITGASGGIGFEAARRLSESGFAVALHFRTRAEAVERLAAELVANGRLAAVLSADLSDAYQVERLVSQTEERLGPLYGLVHAATPRIRPTAPLDVTDELLLEHLSVQAIALARLCKRVLPLLQQKQAGAIAGILSTVIEPNPPKKWMPYIAAKFAAYGVLAGLAADVEGSGIRVVGLMLSGVATELSRDAGVSGPLLQPVEVADAIAGIFTQPQMHPNASVVSLSQGKREIGRFGFVGKPLQT